MAKQLTKPTHPDADAHLGIEVPASPAQAVAEPPPAAEGLPVIAADLADLADRADRLSPPVAQKIRQAQHAAAHAARDAEPRQRQTAAPICGYCRQPMRAASTRQAFTYYRCHTEGCDNTNLVKQPRPRIGQASLQDDFAAR